MATDLFVTLADPTRRRLMDILRGGPRSVGDLVGRVNIEQPGVSRHLRILQEAGFVTVRAQQQRRIYSLRDEPFEQLEKWVRRYRRETGARLDRFSRVVDDG